MPFETWLLLRNAYLFRDSLELLDSEGHQGGLNVHGAQVESETPVVDWW